MIPCSKFKANDMMDQFRHIDSEYREARIAYDDLLCEHHHHMVERTRWENKRERIYHVAEELVDIQVSCETALMILGFSAKEREAIRAKVDEKNRRRGYHE